MILILCYSAIWNHLHPPNQALAMLCCLHALALVMHPPAFVMPIGLMIMGVLTHVSISHGLVPTYFPRA